MAGIVSEESVGRSIEGISSGLRSQSGETLAEWRSSEQLENGTPSTSPPYWDSDEDDDSGPKPSELYGKYTWKIEKFSQLNKRELRSNAFEVGGYKWYILIYPQGCDVCNHLSLFLCVANHDKLLPGWSHFAQFTIAVVNKDPKKSKYSDTLHRFWKKEHDWGWKKFMELSKVLDGFVDADTLIIKAQVQVIRERAEQPFRCLDCQYRRELVRVYLTNVEQICRRFVEERRSKLGKLIEDKNRWLSFCTFWLGLDQSARLRMSREKTDAILKVVVKHFFIEKEVTSTLVMDSLYSGLRALEGQTKNKKVGAKLLEAEEMPAPIVRVEKDMFVLVDDVLLLLERATLEPLPPKDEKGPQNRIKEGSSGEDFNKDSIERDERRLTELGRRTVEIFVLAHIYSNKVEVAYQEAVALKRQEELIREEEAAWQAESEQKARRGATEKEKKAKKKQAKQKRNNRKGREKGREERIVLDRHEKETLSDMKVVTNVEEMQPVLEKPDMLEDVSDVSDSVDAVGEALHPDSEDRETSPVNWDTDTSEIHPPTDSSRSVISSLSSAQTVSSDKKNASMTDDGYSTCSTDSVPSVVMNGSYKGSSFPNYKNQKTPTRRKNQQGNVTSDKTTWGNETDSQASGPSPDTGDQSDVSETSKPGESEPEAAVVSLFHQDQLRGVEQEMAKKEKGMVAPQRKQSPKNQFDTERTLKDKTSVVTSSVQNTQIYLPTSSEQKSEHRSSAYIQKTSSNGSHSSAAPAVTSPPLVGALKSEAQKTLTPKITEKAMVQQVSMMSRPSSAPLIPAPRHPAPVVSVAQTTQPLSRSASAAGRLGPDPLPATHSYAPPQSYRNAIMGNNASPSTTGFTQPGSPPARVNPSPLFSHTTALVSPPVFSSQNSDRLDSDPVKSSFPLGMVSRDVLPNVLQWTDGSQMDGRSVHFNNSSLLNDVQNLEFYPRLHGGNHEQFLADFSACTSGRQGQVLAEEFPHLDIINDLLDEEQCVGKAARSSLIFPSFSNGPTLLNRQFSLPGDVGLSGDVGSSTSSCRFERTHSYHDGGFRRGYSSSIGHFEPVMDYMPPVSTLSYVNGQFDGIISSQWQINSDPSLLRSMNSEYEPFPYLNPEYSNMACRINGYNVFRPSNGN